MSRSVDRPLGARTGWATGAPCEGFTLLELMVVVGVVATMIALLLPTLSHVRESSRRATDLSNLRQLALACTIYAQANDGALPRGRAVSPFSGGVGPLSGTVGPSSGPDDYIWLNYTTCWKPLVTLMPQLDAMNGCTSVRDGYDEASEFGKPQPAKGWPDDVQVGWVYWGGRDDLVDPKTGVPTYRSLRQIGQRRTPGSPTLWTCWCWDSNGSRHATSVCPHVGTRYIEYANGVALQFRDTQGVQPPDGLGVALVDGSASFVPWEELAIVQQANGFKLYYQP